jgi:hypothetical protein
MGFPTGGSTDYAYFGHLDTFGDSTSFALAQSTNGLTYLSAATNQDVNVFARGTGNVNLTSAAGVNSAQLADTGEFTLTDGADTLQFSSDGTNWYQKWSDGGLILQTDEGTNTLSLLSVQGKGTGNAWLLLETNPDGAGNQYTMLQQNGATFNMQGFSGVTEYVINDDSRDQDFRVESGTYDHMFVVDGGTNRSGFCAGSYVSGSLDGTLDVITAGVTDNAYLSLATYNSVGYHPAIQFRKSRSNTMNGHSTTQDTDYIGELYFYGSDGSSWKSGAKLEVIQDGSVSSYTPTTMKLYTTTSSGFNSNQLVLDTSGDIAVGQLTPTSKLDVAGDIEIGSANYMYVGDPTTDGSWRFSISGSDLIFQRRESSSWVTKSTITA